MTDDNSLPILGIVLSCLALGLFSGLVFGTVTERQDAERKTIVYCMEQPKDCKIKYDYFKIENKK